MGVLHSSAREHRIVLLPFHRIGRLPSLDLVLGDDERISREHATLAWTEAGWVVRDLGSRNGTWVGSTRVAPGEDLPLSVGDRLGFGQADGAWTLVSTEPPTAFAQAEGWVVEADQDLLLLPGPDRPLAVVRRDASGAWVLDDGRSIQPVIDGARVEIGGEPLLLRLPVSLPATRGGPGGELPSDAALELIVDEDEEHVLARLSAGGRGFDLGRRAHHRLLLTLARERSRAARRGVDPAELGWVRLEDIAIHLEVSANVLYVHLHRLRAQLSTCGLSVAPAILERRFTGEIRLAAIRLQL